MQPPYRFADLEEQYDKSADGDDPGEWLQRHQADLEEREPQIQVVLPSVDRDFDFGASKRAFHERQRGLAISQVLSPSVYLPPGVPVYQQPPGSGFVMLNAVPAVTQAMAPENAPLYRLAPVPSQQYASVHAYARTPATATSLQNHFQQLGNHHNSAVPGSRQHVERSNHSYRTSDPVTVIPKPQAQAPARAPVIQFAPQLAATAPTPIFLPVQITGPPSPPAQTLLHVGKAKETGRMRNRTGNRRSASYGDLLKGFAPPEVQPPLNIEIGIIEICTFFPHWLQLPEVIMRALRNGWRRSTLAKAQLHAIDNLTKAHLKTASERVQQQICIGGKLFCGMRLDERWSTETAIQRYGQQNDLTANNWKLRPLHTNGPGHKTTFVHVKLSDIRAPVPRERYPTGEDRLLLTQCLEFDAANPGLNLDTSQIDWIIRSQNFVAPPAVGNRDVAALRRLNRRVPEPSV